MSGLVGFSVANTGQLERGRPQGITDCLITIPRPIAVRGIKGEKQAQAVEYMYQQALQERTELSPDEIFTATRIKTGTGGSVRMQSLFKGNPNWTLYIANPRHGIYTFNLA